MKIEQKSEKCFTYIPTLMFLSRFRDFQDNFSNMSKCEPWILISRLGMALKLSPAVHLDKDDDW